MHCDIGNCNINVVIMRYDGFIFELTQGNTKFWVLSWHSSKLKIDQIDDNVLRFSTTLHRFDQAKTDHVRS